MEGLGHVHVAGVQAIGHFSGAAWRQARSGRTEGNRGPPHQPEAMATSSGAAVE